MLDVTSDPAEELDRQLGRILFERGALAAGDLAAAFSLAETADVPLGQVLLAEGFVTQESLISALQQVTGLPRAGELALRTALSSLSTDTAQDVLMTGYLPSSVSSEATFHVSADPAPWRGPGLGMLVASLTTPDDLRAAVIDIWGPAILRQSRNHLAETWPDLSAHRRFSPPQSHAMAAFAILAIALIGAAPAWAGTLATLVLCATFLSVIALKAWAMIHDRPSAHRIPPIRLKDRDLPVYSILVPVFREADVLEDLVVSLLAIDYPAAKLDIKIILEEEDRETRKAVEAIELPGCFEIIVVPRLLPQTKPKALNYALRFIRGSFVVIYDAEDRPEPDQLRLAIARFQEAGPATACLQGRLSFFNPDENWLTRQFTIEYATLFDLLLPVLARFNLPIPLGGTSNHFRVEVLREAGAWDPFNVTEDADLGVRMARLGYRIGVIPSTTYEEANCRPGNWMRQRSRWIKGWIQTWFVHMRSPRRLWSELGPAGFLAFQVMSAGIILSGLLHPVFTIALIWKLASSDATTSGLNGAEIALATLSVVVFTSGLSVAIFSGLMALSNRPDLRFLRFALMLTPVYWLMISAGAWFALWEFIRRPFHWQKTRHGLSRQRAP
ncbi:cellulose synthase/poly-beta-1,6-N-acetylglucosamine synthase-like glycosyltransferase [Rhodoligotrophos appendicifer]|uniref:glycosyltransferase family 2 protein n=1 Tax=Rhodoligotrophos appendicifer TaxID=987056 RepID=UPI0011871ECF|nr:glycosyltransferase [Rhodoligotrophos appendicifer]